MKNSIRRSATTIAVRISALGIVTAAFFLPQPSAQAVPTGNYARLGSIHYFVEQDDLPHVKALLKADPKLIEQHQSYLGTPLAVAASEGKMDIVQYLIAHKAYVNARCADEYDSQTVLMAACTGFPFPDDRRLAIVMALVHAGALVRVVDRSGYTALHTAAYYGHSDIVNFLVLHGADLDAIDQDGRTPFTEAMRGAAMWDDWRLMRFIRVAIAQGADVNARSASGETMLDLAARAGVVHTLEYLLLQGADVTARDRSGRTVLEIAIQRNQTDAANILRQHGATAATGDRPKTVASAATPVSGP